MAEDTLARAIALARTGRKTEARALLLQILRADPRAEAAWLWLADCAANQAERVQVLEACLRFLPESQKARAGLAALRRAPGGPAAPPEPPPQSPEGPAQAQAAEPPTEPPWPPPQTVPAPARPARRGPPRRPRPEKPSLGHIALMLTLTALGIAGIGLLITGLLGVW